MGTESEPETEEKGKDDGKAHADSASDDLSGGKLQGADENDEALVI